MKKTFLTCLITTISMLAFSQDFDLNSVQPIQMFVLNDHKTADLLKNVKQKSEAIDSVLKNKNKSFLNMADSISLEIVEAKVKSIKVYSNNVEYVSENDFYTKENQANKKELILDTNANMNIKAKTKLRDENFPTKWIIQDVIARETKIGYILVLKKVKSK